MNYIEDLRHIIRKLHGVDSRHVESVPIKEVYQGKTVWEGVVEVFELVKHPEATHVFAWSHATDKPGKPRRRITVLKIPPVLTPLDAVRAAVVQEFRSGNVEEA